MYKPTRALVLVAIILATGQTAVLAQDSSYQNAGYPAAAPMWPQQAPQGYQTPQYDAYRGEAQQSVPMSGTNYNQPIQPESNSASRAVMEAQQPTTSASDKPIKPDGRTLGHVALPVAGLGAMYMVTRAATRAGMMQGMMGSGYGGYGGGYGYGNGYGNGNGYGMMNRMMGMNGTRGYGW